MSNKINQKKNTEDFFSFISLWNKATKKSQKLFWKKNIILINQFVLILNKQAQLDIDT